MMRMRTKGAAAPFAPPAKESAREVKVEEWEVRPGGMLVQKHSEAAAVAAATPVPTIRVRVKYGAAYHEIYLSSRSTFGEVKKLLSERTGLHPQDQKLEYKGKEKESSAFLDISGVKDRSKIVLLEDPVARAKRLIEERRAAKSDKAFKSIASISLEVDGLASKVTTLEAIVSKGGKVAENDVLGLIEQLMMQLIRLDGIVADGDAKLQRGMQVRRVQKYVETLDALKIKNAMHGSNGSATKQQQQQQPAAQQQQQQRQHQKVQPFVVTQEWEMFDSLLTPSSSAALSTTSTTTTTSTISSNSTPRLDWELF